MVLVNIISTNFYQSEILFVQSILNNLQIGQNKTEIGFIIFDETVEYSRYFNKYNSYNDIINDMATWNYPGGGYNLDFALSFYHDYVYPTADPALDVVKIVVVLTDGSSNYNISKGVIDIRNTSAKVFTIGIGNNTNYTELSNIASSPPEKYVRTVTDFTFLKDIISIITSSVCNEPVEVTPNSSNTSLAIEISSKVGSGAMKYFKFTFKQFNIQNYKNSLGFTIQVDDLFGSTFVYTSLTNQNPDYFDNDKKIENGGSKTVVIKISTNNLRFLENTMINNSNRSNSSSIDWAVYVSLLGVSNQESNFNLKVWPYAQTASNDLLSFMKYFNIIVLIIILFFRM